MKSAAPIPDDRLAKRNVAVLVAAQAIIGAQLPMMFTVAGLAGTTLSPNPCWATLPITAMVLGSMLAANPLSAIMARFGRRAGFVLGTVCGALGAIVSAFGLYAQNFYLFVAGALLTGTYMSAQGFFRFAATDSASDAFRPKAISYVMAGGLLSAVVGPQLVKLTADAMVIPYLGTYLTVIALNSLGVFLFAFLHAPVPPPTLAGAPQGRSRMELLATPRIAVAVICATVSYALMNLMMTSSPIAVVGCGYTKANAADVVMFHVLAMYAPSFFTGHLITRFGAERIVGTGLAILTGAGIVALAGVDLMNFYLALVLLGLGWNFGFIGATAMLTASYTPAERGRMQGLNDFIVFGGVTLASLSSGGLMNCSGSSVIDGWHAVNMAMIPFLVLAGASLIWLAAGKRRLPQ
jgi:MFS family permease